MFFTKVGAFTSGGGLSILAFIEDPVVGVARRAVRLGDGFLVR